MTVGEFANLVASMRMHQKRYFQTRRKDDLANAKWLEDKVDKALDEHYARLEKEGNLNNRSQNESEA